MEDSDEETGVEDVVCVAVRDDCNRGDMRLLDACPCAGERSSFCRTVGF